RPDNDFRRRVRGDRGLRPSGIWESYGVRQLDPAVLHAAQGLELVQQRVLAVPDLGERADLMVYTMTVGGDPLAAGTVEPDSPALDFDQQDSLARMGNDEVNLPVPRSALGANQPQPGDVVKHHPAGTHLLAQQVIKAHLRGKL